MTWCVVHFIKDDSVEVVPKKWMVGDECFYPPGGRSKIIHHMKSQHEPDSNWKLFKIRILGEYDDYNIANRKCDRAKDQDNLSSSSSCSELLSEIRLGKGYRVKKPMHFSDVDEEDDDEGDNIRTKIPPVPNPVASQISGISGAQTTSKSKRCFIDSPTPSERTELSVPSPHDVHEETKCTSANIETEGYRNIISRLDRLEKEINDVNLVNKEFQRQVLRQLFVLNARMKDQAENIELLDKHFDKQFNNNHNNHPDDEVNTEIIEKMKLFPLRNEEDLSSMEQLLKETKDMNLMAKELSLLGGKSLKEICKRLMFQILTNEVGQNYSWEGAKGKKAFKNLYLSQLIIRTVRNNSITKDSTEAEIIIFIKDWLVRAKFRLLNVK